MFLKSNRYLQSSRKLGSELEAKISGERGREEFESNYDLDKEYRAMKQKCCLKNIQVDI